MTCKPYVSHELCNYVATYVPLFNVCYIEEISEIQIADIQMPPKMKKKGRPKGNGLTVVGLPKKANGGKPTPFIKKSEWEKNKCK